MTAVPEHPVLAATEALLAEEGHVVEHLLPGPTAEPAPLADVYLLKANTPAALAFARGLERLGARVVNSAASTEFCQDRAHMACLARRAGLPFPATTELPGLDALLAYGPVRRPLVVKSRRSRRGNLVALVADDTQLRELVDQWPGESVVVQELAPSTGWDHKVWVVADRIFAELRRSELAVGEQLPSQTVGELPSGWSQLALRVGEVFGLDVYGVDILDVRGTPLIVDVNAFPGIRGQPAAPAALARLAIEVAAGEISPRVIAAAPGTRVSRPVR
ncbi:RimK family alpha-L-glutamate ligase [Streptomyces sp. NPDC056501]|uniref:ATP-grasp domain-containing protein n=1 Tax=Streptomyces sp. NPDC056501 TaxID=3345841 RepID=UPI0036A9C005